MKKSLQELKEMWDNGLYSDTIPLLTPITILFLNLFHYMRILKK